MRGFLILAAVAALGSARPEAGYNYNAPGGSFGSGGFSSGSFGGGSVGGGFGGGSSSFTSGSSSFASGSSGFGIGSSGFGIGSGGFGSGSGGFGSGSGGFGSGPSGFGIGSGGFAGSSGFSGGAIVQKHIYVHVPPPEPEDNRPQIVGGGGVPQKHYKIIFIKAPSPPTPVTPVIPAQALNEEKTLVYVLVKRPDEQGDISIPTPAPTQPSKPEVYFIKYRAQKGAGGVGGIGGGISTGGVSGGISGGLSSGSGVSSSYGAPAQSGPY